jgi:hypothetical protein
MKKTAYKTERRLASPDEHDALARVFAEILAAPKHGSAPREGLLGGGPGEGPPDVGQPSGGH